jgi:hypothetical protein
MHERVVSKSIKIFMLFKFSGKTHELLHVNLWPLLEDCFKLVG